MLISTKMIDAEEEAATADVAAAKLADLAGDDDPTMPPDLQGWMSFDWEEMGDLDFTPTQMTRYTVPKFRGR
jgi:hypothetical protein